jgi:hypothetical protein
MSKWANLQMENNQRTMLNFQIASIGTLNIVRCALLVSFK